jgi:nucleoside-diphosphate-sugar epimerase
LNVSETAATRVLVTGGTGYIGSHLVRGLVIEGHDVHILVRKSSSLHALEDLLPELTIHRCSSGRELAKIMTQSRPAIVFHLATMQSEPAALEVGAIIENNITFGSELVAAMLATGCRRLINTGTSWQHFEGRDYSPVNLYAATKQAFADIVQYYVEACGLSAITLKLFDTYGPRDPRPKLVRLLHEGALSQQPLALSPGEQLIDLVYVSDVVAAYLQAARLMQAAPPPAPAQYAVSSGCPISLRELVSRYEAVSGRQLNVQWGALAYRARQVMTPWQGSILPGWRCTVDLDTGLRQVVEA